MCKEHSQERMVHRSIAGCKNKLYFNLTLICLKIHKDERVGSVEIKAIYRQMFMFVPITLKASIFTNHGIYKTGFFTQTNQ